MAIVDVVAENLLMSWVTRAHGGHLHKGTTLPSYQRLTQHLAAITPDPYVVVNGYPQQETGLGPAMVCTAYLDNSGITAGQLLPPGSPLTDVLPPPIPPADGTAVTPPTVTYQTQPVGTPEAPPGVPPAKVIIPPGTGKPGITTANMTVPPKASNPGSDHRFLPLAGDFTGTVWGAHKGTKLYPKIKLVTRSGFKNDPVRDSRYFYIQHNPTEHINAPALCLNGNSYLQIVTGDATDALRTHSTFLMVFVPHHGKGSYYPIYSCARKAANGTNKRVLFRYVKGHVWLYFGNTCVKKIPLSLAQNEPVMFGFSWNGTIASVTVWDRGKQHYNFHTKGTYDWGLNADIGAAPLTSGGSTIDWANAADMDVLEIDMWEIALSSTDMNTSMAHLAHLYGVGRH
jgi:hypothetical protein